MKNMIIVIAEMEQPEVFTALKAHMLPSGKDKETGTGKHGGLIVFHQHSASNTGVARGGETGRNWDKQLLLFISPATYSVTAGKLFHYICFS